MWLRQPSPLKQGLHSTRAMLSTMDAQMRDLLSENHAVAYLPPAHLSPRSPLFRPSRWPRHRDRTAALPSSALRTTLGVRSPTRSRSLLGLSPLALYPAPVHRSHAAGRRSAHFQARSGVPPPCAVAECLRHGVGRAAAAAGGPEPQVGLCRGPMVLDRVSGRGWGPPGRRRHRSNPHCQPHSRRRHRRTRQRQQAHLCPMHPQARTIVPLLPCRAAISSLAALPALLAAAPALAFGKDPRQAMKE